MPPPTSPCYAGEPLATRSDVLPTNFIEPRSRPLLVESHPVTPIPVRGQALMVPKIPSETITCRKSLFLRFFGLGGQGGQVGDNPLLVPQIAL